MANQYPNSGSLFVRDKRSPKAADYGGDFTLDNEVLDYVLRQAERGQPVKLEISGWKRMGRNNTTFISVKIDTPYAERQQNGGARQPQRGGYQQQPQRQQSYGQQRGGGEQGYMTSQGRFPSQQGTQHRGSPQNQQMRQDLNDDIPFGNDPPARGGNNPPWE